MHLKICAHGDDLQLVFNSFNQLRLTCKSDNASEAFMRGFRSGDFEIGVSNE
jgi:hypothetical protein